MIPYILSGTLCHVWQFSSEAHFQLHNYKSAYYCIIRNILIAKHIKICAVIIHGISSF